MGRARRFKSRGGRQRRPTHVWCRGGGGKDGGFSVRGRRRWVRERAGGSPIGIKGAAFASDPQFSSTSSSQDKMKCIVSI